jgi:hypothetical protein
MEPLEVAAMVHDVDGRRAVPQKIAKEAGVALRAGDHETSGASPDTQIAGKRRVEVLRVGRETEGRPARQTTHIRDRGRAVGKMGMQVSNSLPP